MNTKLPLLLTLLLLGLLCGAAARAGVALPNGTADAGAVDLRVKVVGGLLAVGHRADPALGAWQVSPRWRPAGLAGRPAPGGCPAYPQLTIQGLTYSGDGLAWALDNRYSVRATGFFAGDRKSTRLNSSH